MGERDPPPGGAVQAPRARHRRQVAPQPHDPFVDPPPVHFELRFARPADEPQAAALALEMRPAADQTAALIGQRCQFDLQPPFPRARSRSENFEDQRCPVERLHAPRAFEIAMLDRRQRRVHDHDVGSRRRRVEALRQRGNLSRPEQRRRARAADWQRVRAANFRGHRTRQPHRFFQPRTHAALPRTPRRLRLEVGMQDPGAARSRGGLGSAHPASPSAPSAESDTRKGRAGTTVEIACL